ncbi:hypothetical protein CLOP_g8945 [Closterium sp. NIES-67]|nr:hypothetical protein CLOP_g8945 [Closterium sp. NIES-67]
MIQSRLIFDLRHVNSFLSVPPFRYEGLNRVPELVQQDDWLSTIDLKSGYHHVDIHPSYWRFLGFTLQGQRFQFLSLPFGLATAPFVFTQLIKQLAKRWRGRSIRLIPYVDDILFINATRAEALSHCAVILADLQSAGFAVNFRKSQLEPTHCLKPPHCGGTRFETDLPSTISAKPHRTSRHEETDRVSPRQMTHPTIHFTIQCPSTLHTETGRKPAHVHRLPSPQQADHQEQVPDSTNR